MYSNAKHVAPMAVLILLILCVLSTEQTLFSRKKSSTPVSPVDNVSQQSKPVPQKETSHWWQMKSKPAESNENSVSNQVAVPVPIHQKLHSIFETHFNPDIKWVPCLCPVRKGENIQQHHHHQQQQQQQPQQHQQKPQQHQQQPQQPQQHQQQPQKSGPSYYPSSTAEALSDLSSNDVPRFIFANYPIEA
ncbi:hypothetical protein QTP88_026792 [Uroleucon formosanum]